MPIKLCLNMIVKDEAARIERALDSCIQFVTAAVIVDTGSTDNTKEILTKYFADHRVPLLLTDAPFQDWSQARNKALIRGREYCCVNHVDYLLLMDADMELVVKDAMKFLATRSGPSYDVYQHAGVLHYQNRRMVRADTTGLYEGVTHEYLGVDTAGCIPEDAVYFVDHADGANRPQKFKRDIKLLREGIRKEPNNGRYFYYLAQSYRDAGQPANALYWYRKRVEFGGWEEERWSAQVNFAHCYREMGNEAEFIRNLLIAYNMRPSRAEALYDLAHHYRMKDGSQVTANLFAEIGMAISPSSDALFVNDYVYKAGLKEEFAITAFYTPGKKHKGFEVADHLSLLDGPYGSARETARFNLYWYLPTLKEVCPSFSWKKLDIALEPNWTALNPSVALKHNSLRAVIRTVNYRMDDQGRYIIQGTDGTANATNPINTRNFYVSLDEGLSITHTAEIMEPPPEDFPVKFPLVVGFEDMRLFEWQDDMCFSATVRQLHEDGNCEQVLGKIVSGDDPSHMQVKHLKQMPRQPRQTEKNWAPIVQGYAPVRFMHRLGHVVNMAGVDTIVHPTGMATGHISGGSQVIPFEDGWLSIVHEARQLPGSHLRYYYHRFAFFDSKFALKKLSRPFVFNDKLIEFCAGMCWHPDEKHLVISYGWQDKEARIATVDHKEVSHLLWLGSK